MTAKVSLLLLSVLAIAGTTPAVAQESDSLKPEELRDSLVADTMPRLDSAQAERVRTDTGLVALSATDSPYDPKLDIIPPAAARWLYLGSLLYEAPLWSAAINGCFGFYDDYRKATAVQLLASPASFFVFLLASRRREITLGMLHGSVQGTGQGFAAGFVAGNILFDWGDRDIGKFFPELGTAVAASIASHVVGLRFAERERLNCGNVQMLGQAGIWGGLYGGYLISLAVPWSGTAPFRERLPRKLIEAAALTGWGAGLYYWHKLGPRDFTTGDAVSVNWAEGLGVLTAAAAWSLVPGGAQDRELSLKAATLLPAAVNAAGLWYSYRFHRHRDLSFGQSLLVSLGTGLGVGSIGGAMALLLTPESGDDAGKITLWSMAAGGWLGFHLTHALLETDKPGKGRFSANREPRYFAFTPANALGLFVAAKAGTSCRVPLVSFEF